ncbi:MULTISPECIES: YSIRK-type signal peptide-containing protein [Lactobacillus]|uniref:YSIRK-type signal peptide-containing protein n=1 Tax=Lactobacillus TaxID=1578 RepID=UPI001314A766|nr:MULTISPECIES: YSIRK-type signal peptide-containing protein [Lactobacillus]
MQDKQDHFSIRKLSIGAASVLLGFTFFGLNSQSVKADTIDPSQNVTEESNRDNSNTETKETGTKDKTKADAAASKKKNETDLSTFSGLSSFLKSSKTDEVKDTSSKDKTDTTAKDKTDKDKQETPDSTGNSTTTPATGSDEVNQDTTTDKTPTAITDSDDQNSDSSKLPADVTGGTNSDKDTTVSDEDTTTADKTGLDGKAVQTKVDDNTPEIIGTVAKVRTWNQFVNALELNTPYIPKGTVIDEIDIMNDIEAPDGASRNGLQFEGRKLTIKSDPNSNHRYKLDFIGNHPRLDGASKEELDLHYENLELWSADYWGVIMTDRYHPDDQHFATVTFKDCDFHGTQMVHCHFNTKIIFEGVNTAETVYLPYGGHNTYKDEDQQLLEFTRDNNTIDFRGKFTGTTFGGNVIEMYGNNNKVIVEKGANVTFNPAGNYDKTLYTDRNGAEHTGTIFGIMMRGNSEDVEIEGNLNINVGKDFSGNSAYTGDYDCKQASGIFIKDDATNQFNILSGGYVGVTTNGNIATYSDYSGRILIYDGGSFTINPNGKLDVTGNDMGDYEGTLVYIKGKADVENGAFNIRLTDDKTGTGAGNGKITLVDAKGDLIVNNPTSLVLDCHLNHKAGTSIVGQNKITITNVRQVLTPDESHPDVKLTLPPFHVLQVVNTGNNSVEMNVPYLELLNGTRKFTNKEKALLDKNKQVQAILQKYDKVAGMLDAWAKANEGAGTSYDDIFKQVIKFAFSDPTNPGYNNIAFKPANPSGFLDIDPNTVHVTYNSDGTSTISGHVLNYKEEKDGETSDGIFNLLLPGGTKAHVQAIITDPKGNETVWKPETWDSKKDDPYADTNDTFKDPKNKSLKPLEHEFSAKVKSDGTFELTIPKDETDHLTKGYKIALYPDANFVQYNPLAKDRPIIKDVLVAAQDTAAQEIQDELDKITDEYLNLTDDQERDLNDAIAAAKAAIDNPGQKGKSIYAEDVKTIPIVNERKNNALKALNEAYETAKALSDAANAIKDTQTIAKTNISKAAQDAIIRVKLSGLSEDKQNEYIKNIDDAENAALENPATSDSSIYYPGKTKAQIEDLQQKATDKINKAAAKAEVAGYTEKGENTLGIPSPDSDIDSALIKNLIILIMPLT